uniref:Putative secreted protein n=1 Tax=Anopheles marajoara TaxID=58244 RepID=A0A2M4C762_9DIPT
MVVAVVVVVVARIVGQDTQLGLRALAVCGLALCTSVLSLLNPAPCLPACLPLAQVCRTWTKHSDNDGGPEDLLAASRPPHRQAPFRGTEAAVDRVCMCMCPLAGPSRLCERMQQLLLPPLPPTKKNLCR